MEIIAHRGASADAPENTLPAVHLAWQHNADAVEVDVHITRDHHTVVIHDPTTARTAETNRSVAHSSLAELRRLDVGKWKGPQWTGTLIPTLAEVVSTIPEGKRLVIELKFPSHHTSPFIDLCKTFPPEKLLLIGFSLEIMRLMRNALPGCETGLIVDFTPHPGTGQWHPPLEDRIKQATAARLGSLDLDAKGPINRDLVQRIHNAGLRCYVWTVDSIARAQQLVQAGVDGITTNTPTEMIQALRP